MGRQCRIFDYITPILHDEKNNFVGEHPEKVVILKLQVAELALQLAVLDVLEVRKMYAKVKNVNVKGRCGSQSAGCFPRAEQLLLGMLLPVCELLFLLIMFQP